MEKEMNTLFSSCQCASPTDHRRWAIDTLNALELQYPHSEERRWFGPDNKPSPFFKAMTAKKENHYDHTE
jgi:hypothetical protein